MKTTTAKIRWVDPHTRPGDKLRSKKGWVLFLRPIALQEDAEKIAYEEGGEVWPSGPAHDPTRLWAVVVPMAHRLAPTLELAARKDNGRGFIDDDMNRDDDGLCYCPDEPGVWDFQKTFPLPTDAAARELVADMHYPHPDDAEAVWNHFEAARQEYTDLLDAGCEACERARELRATGCRRGSTRKVKHPERESKALEDDARRFFESADALISEVARIYGDQPAHCFKKYCDDLRFADAADEWVADDEQPDDGERWTLDQQHCARFATVKPAAQLDLF